MCGWQFLGAAHARRVCAWRRCQEQGDKVHAVEKELCEVLAAVSAVTSTTGSVYPGPSTSGCHGGGGGDERDRGYGSHKLSRDWWSDLLHLVEQRPAVAADFLSTLECCIEQGEAAYPSMRNFRGLAGLNYLLGREFAEVEQARCAVLGMLRMLPATPTAREIAEAADCKRCRAYFQKTGPVCQHCRAQDIILAYASHIHAYRRRTKRMVVDTTAGAMAHKQNAAIKKKKQKLMKNKRKHGQEQQQTGGSDGAHMLGSGFDNEDFNDDGQEEGRKVGANWSGAGESFVLREQAEDRVDGTFMMVVKYLRSCASKHRSSLATADTAYSTASGKSRASSSCSGCSSSERVGALVELSRLEVRRSEALVAELVCMGVAWERYSELLKAHDELQQCKSTMTLRLPPSLLATLQADPSATAAAHLDDRQESFSSSTCRSTSTGISKGKNGGGGGGSEQNNDGMIVEETEGSFQPHELPSAFLQSLEAAAAAEEELQRTKGSMGFYQTQARAVEAEDESKRNQVLQRLRGVALNVSDRDRQSPSYSTAGLAEAASNSASASVGNDLEKDCIFCREELVLMTSRGRPAAFPLSSSEGPSPRGAEISKKAAADEGGREKAAEEEVEVEVEVEEVVMLPCAHRFHRACVSLWVRRHGKCPLCKVPARIADLTALAHGKSKTSSAATEAATVVVEGGGQRGSGDECGPNDLNPTARVGVAAATEASQGLGAVLRGRWGTKVDAFTLDLLYWLQDPAREEEKAIVFSQWTEVNFNMKNVNMPGSVLFR